MGRLDVRIVEARNLPNKSLIAKPDPYTSVSLENSQHKTSVAASTLNPKWDEVFKFVIADPDSAQLELKVYDKNLVSDTFLGQYRMSLAGLTKGVVKDVWVLLQQCSTNAELHIRLMAHDFGIDPTPAQLQQQQAAAVPVPVVQQSPPQQQQQFQPQPQPMMQQPQPMMYQQQPMMQPQPMMQQPQQRPMMMQQQPAPMIYQQPMMMQQQQPPVPMMYQQQQQPAPMMMGAYPGQMVGGGYPQRPPQQYPPQQYPGTGYPTGQQPGYPQQGGAGYPGQPGYRY